MKKQTTVGKLELRTLTIADLTHVAGGIAGQPFPRDTAEPSRAHVSLPPKSDGCFTDTCPTETQPR